MTHVFQIHSPLTYAGAVHYIHVKNLPLENCVFLCWRGADQLIDVDVKHVIYHYAVDNIDFAHALSFKLNELKKIRDCQIKAKAFRSWFKSIVSDEFIYYVPHLSYIRDRLIVQENKCKGYYFLEEGLGVYNPLIHQERLDKYNERGVNNLKNKLKSHLIFGCDVSINEGVYFIYDKFLGAIGYTKNSFLHFPKRLLVGLPFKNKRPVPEVEHLFVFDNFINENSVQTKLYFEVIQLLFEKLDLKKVKTIHFKVHPAILHSSIHNELVKQQIQHGEKNTSIHFIELDTQQSIEELAISNRDTLTIYGIYSASLFYAHESGASTYLLTNELMKRDPLFKKYIMKHFPPVFLNLAESNAFKLH